MSLSLWRHLESIDDQSALDRLVCRLYAACGGNAASMYVQVLESKLVALAKQKGLCDTPPGETARTA
jgi:hypothetical protein